MKSLERYESQFRELFGNGRGEPGWLPVARRAALDRFLEKGFPSTDQEEWRFTNVAPLSKTDFDVAGPTDDTRAAALLRELRFGDWERHELVFVNGHFDEKLSSLGELPERVVVEPLARALATRGDLLEAVLAGSKDDGETPFFDLNHAFMVDGAFVQLPRNVVLEAPLHLVFLTLAGGRSIVSHPVNVILAESGSQVRIVETYGGEKGDVYFTNAVTTVRAEENAVVEHYKVQLESSSAFHVATSSFLQERNAVLSDYSLSFGARLARNDIKALLDGEGTEVTLNGLYVVRGSQHVDHHTVIDHKWPHGTSRELYKGILDDVASGVFNGRIIVRQDAQKTDSEQKNKNLLLSRDALVNTNPQLEINADDVKCAHGATIGQLDNEALFYLRSRGIPLEQARKILTQGFVADVSERIRIAAVRDRLREILFSEAA
jgi:Fe-S cluster assembly protein SufD